MKLKAFERLNQLRALKDADILSALTDDESDVVRHEAAFILGDRKREGTLLEIESVFKALGESILEDKSTLVRHEAALALANFDKVESLKFLKFALCDSVTEVRESAAYAIEDLNGRK